MVVMMSVSHPPQTDDDEQKEDEETRASNCCPNINVHDLQKEHKQNSKKEKFGKRRRKSKTQTKPN